MNIKILLVDDEESFNFYHQIVLEDLGWSGEILTFVNGEGVFDYLQTCDDTEHLLLFLDINMPRMNTWTFLELVQRDFPQRSLRVVVVSSSIDESDKQRAFQFPQVINFVEKPVTDTVFQETLATLKG